VKLFFALEGYDAFHRKLWERRLQELQAHAQDSATLVDHADDADAIVETIGRHSLSNGTVFRVSQASHYARQPERTFMWDSGDLPTGRLPGLYCSLPDSLFDPARHRSFCYPLRSNPLIEFFPPEDARFLCGFVGGMTSGLRWRMLEILKSSFSTQEATFEISDGVWGRIYGGGAEDEFRRYAEALRRSRFFLCPRGNGVSSVRIYETMAAGRVPVILSDHLVLPQCVDWGSCSVRVRERDLPRLREVLRGHESNWEFLAHNARQAWELNFGEQVLMKVFAGELKKVITARRTPERLQSLLFPPRILPAYLVAGLKRAARGAQGMLRKGRTSGPGSR